MEAAPKTTVQTTRPRIQRVYVQVRDPDSGEIKHVTLYGATLDQILAKLMEPVVPDEVQQQRTAQTA